MIRKFTIKRPRSILEARHYSHDYYNVPFFFFFFLRNAWSPFCQDVNKKVGLVEKVRAAGDVFHAFISDVPPNSIHREYLVRISPSSNFLAGIIRGVSFFKETLERESPPIFPFYFLEFINDRRRFITP